LWSVTKSVKVRAMSGLRVKICGVTSEADARAAARFGADAIGLNFYDGSPRHIDPRVVPAILTSLPPFVEPVGIYVGLRLAQMAEQARHFGLRSIQWHGDNADREPGCPEGFRLIAAFAIRTAADLETITRYLSACRELGQSPAAVLVDAGAPGQYGGTGRTAPWDLLANFDCGLPLILAGGLTPDNVAEAVRLVRPYGVDVASGVESRPGVKDLDTMQRFIAAAREAAER
jgi:phosphoribosylanthranilate isomerase